MTAPVVREGVLADAPTLARIHRASRAVAMPWLPVAHDEAETLDWFTHVVLVEHRVLMAEDVSGVLAFCAVHEGWLEQLYVTPGAQGRGHGRALLDAAKAENPDGLHLHVFARNERARRFYEAAGFTRVAHGDGSATEEGEPERTYAWPAPA